MFIAPVIFLCNTVLFALLLEERFKLITTLAISALSYILALAAGGIAGAVFADPDTVGTVGNALCILLLFIASVFISSNNFTQKLFVALLLLANYAFVTDFVPHLLGAAPFDVTGIVAILLANGIYILFSLLTAAFFAQPLHYFFRRAVSPSMIGLCVLQLLCWLAANGAAGQLLESFPLRFFVCLSLYLVVIFCFRSIYGGARYKARDIRRSADSAVMDIQADSFGAMLVNVNAYKTVKKNLDYQLDRIAALAQAGKTREIGDYVDLSKRSGAQIALLTDYCEDPYINAVIATKTALAQSKNIRLESSVSLGEASIPVIEVCVIVNDILAMAIDETQRAEGDKSIRLSLLPTGNQLTFEAVYTQAGPQTQEEAPPVYKRTFFSFLEPFFEPKESGDDHALQNVMDIVEKRSGKIGISHSQGTAIARVGINY